MLFFITKLSIAGALIACNMTSSVIDAVIQSHYSDLVFIIANDEDTYTPFFPEPPSAQVFLHKKTPSRVPNSTGLRFSQGFGNLNAC